MSDKRPLKLLLVEDSEDDELLLLRALRKGGFKVDHIRVQSESEMRQALTDGEWDVIISDFNLPEFSATAALALYNELESDLPFITVSGTVSEESAVTALRSGAHDFIVKGKFSRLVPAVEREMKEYAHRQARRQAEQALVESQRRFRSLIENSLDIITVVDAGGRITYVSPSIETVLGHRPEDAIGASLVQFSHPEDREHLQEMLSQLARSPGESRRVEFRLRDSSGNWLVLESIGKSLVDDPVIGGVVVNSRDVTLRKAAESRLKKANEELRQAQEHLVRRERLTALGEMASGITHDFNNALSSILGFSEALIMYPDILEDQEQTMELIRMINVSAQDAAQVVERLGEFYRTRERPEDLELIDLNVVVQQAVRLTQPRWKGQARASGVQIEVGIEPGEIPKTCGNASEIRQALTNLIFNATDAMNEGGRLTLRTLPRPNADEVCIEVQDTGMGMDEETRSRCLEPFFTTKGQKGTGMGLAMVYGIVRRHMGMMEVDSQPGEGTTFRLLLPVSGPTPDQQTETDPETRHQAQSLRVLVVEEEPIVRKVVTTFLSADGHLVETADNGNHAVEKLKEALQAESPFHIVITARATSGISGEQLAALSKEMMPEASVVMLTGVSDGHSPDFVDVVVAKPFTLETFRRALGQVGSAG